MNERIKDLAEQAGLDMTYLHCIEGSSDDLMRFVELIIKESITEIEKHDYHATWLGEKLKEHFEVEQ